jgi:hypothetical protein
LPSPQRRFVACSVERYAASTEVVAGKERLSAETYVRVFGSMNDWRGAVCTYQAEGGDPNMYDRDLTTTWRIEIRFDEDETHTHATVRVDFDDGDSMTAVGDARRNPRDPSQPMIGEEIAAARGLIALGTELLHRAGSRIEAVTRHPVHLVS